MRRAVLTLALLVALPTAAQQFKTPEEVARILADDKAGPGQWPRGRFSLALTAGVAFGELPPGVAAGLEATYAPPVLGRQLLFGITTSFKKTSLPSGLPGARYTVDVDELAAAGIVSFHLYPGTFPLAPFAGVGAGVCAMRAVTNFTGDSSRSERELRPIVLGFVGLQLHAGQGALELQFRAQTSTSQTPVLKGSSVVPDSITIGYRFSL